MRPFEAPNETERGEILVIAERLIEWGGNLDAFLETGDVPDAISIGGGTHGPLRDGRVTEHDRKAALLYRPGAEELAETRVWHDYCNEHGYPTGELGDADKAPGNTYPPSPERFEEGVWVGLNWAAIRRALKCDSEPSQLDLLAEAA